MRAPEFWHSNTLTSRVLSPLSHVYAWAVARNLANGEAFRPTIPVICVGNIISGGAGKTPVCLALVDLLRQRGLLPHVLTRGYGGTESGPCAVDLLRHNAARVGDEALLLAGRAPTWVAHWRPDGAKAAQDMGANILVMDDGFQNGSIAKDLSLVVVDGGYGFGNGRVIPAGPCREPIAIGLQRADAVVLIGEDQVGIDSLVTTCPILRADLVPGPEGEALRGRKVLAFAGIGRPEKFFETLLHCGAELVETQPFPDHYPYAESDVTELRDSAAEQDAVLVTTAKDMVRIPPGLRSAVTVVPVGLRWRDPAAVQILLDRVCGRVS